VGGYKRDVANRVLAERYGVETACGFRDSDCEVWEYIRTLPDGSRRTAVHTFDAGLAAYPADALLRICRDLGLDESWNEIRQEIAKQGGWTGRGS